MTPEHLKSLLRPARFEPCDEPDCDECTEAQARDDEYDADHDPEFGNRSEA